MTMMPHKYTSLAYTRYDAWKVLHGVKLQLLLCIAS